MFYSVQHPNDCFLLIKDPDKFFVTNNNIIQNEISPSDVAETCHSEILSLDSINLSDGTSQLWKYTVNMYRIFLDIKRLLDQLEPNQTSVTIDIDPLALSIHTCCKFGLEPYLHPAMVKNKCFSTTYQTTDIHSVEECYSRLTLGIRTFSQLLLLKEFADHKHFDEVLLTFLAAIFSTTRNDTDLIHRSLDQIFERVPEKHFHTLLILKCNSSLPASLQKMLHRELMKRLVCTNGFEVLCKTLIKTGDDHNSNEPIWKLSSAVFDIVGRKGHQKDFYAAVINGIFQFFKKCIQSKELEKYVETCVGSLNRIYALKVDELSSKVVALSVGRLDVLYSPDEIFAGYIVLDSHEFMELILINFACFCSSVHVALPTEMLVPYLRVLCQIFSQIEVTDLRNKISTLIVQCLHNREPSELKSIVNSLLFTDNDNYLKSMHPRIVIKTNNSTGEHQCVVAKASDLNFFDASECLINILKLSGNNILMYSVFIYLFGLLSGDDNASTQSKSDLIENEDELTQLMSQVFKKRVAVYYTLSELINHKPLHYQINENSTEMLSICMTILRNQLTNPESGTDDHSTLLVLSIIKEFLERIKFTQQFDEFLKILQQLKAQSRHNETVNQINSILVAVNHSPETTIPQHSDKSPFGMAKEMCEESEPHLKVYGLMQFIKLIRTDKDSETINSKHAVLAISLVCLKDDDSYVFLNCIKLLIVLCDVLESVVLEMLIAEYQSTENDIDHRLKIGEVIVKVVEGLGKLKRLISKTLGGIGMSSYG